MGERFAVGDTDEERAYQSGALGNADGVKVGEIQIGLCKGFADDRDDLAKVFARGEFGDNAAVFAMDVDLRSDYAGKDFAAVGDDGCGGFVAGRFDAKDTDAHPFMLAQPGRATRGCRQRTLG